MTGAGDDMLSIPESSVLFPSAGLTGRDSFCFLSLIKSLLFVTSRLLKEDLPVWNDEPDSLA